MYKLTQKEAIQLMADELDKVREKHRVMTFRAAAEKCLRSKQNGLSPATVRGYRSAIKAISARTRAEAPTDRAFCK